MFYCKDIYFLFRYLEYPPRHLGIEQLICWIFKQLGYKVTNPCEVLKVYHLHCGVRIQRGFNINVYKAYNLAWPTSDLY